MTISSEATKIITDKYLPFRQGFSQSEKVELLSKITKEACRGDSVKALAFQISRIHCNEFGQPFAGNDAYVQLAKALTEFTNT